MKDCLYFCKIFMVMTWIIAISTIFADCHCNENDYKVTKHYFEERSAFDPSLVIRDYLLTEFTELVEAVIVCSFQYAGAQFTTFLNDMQSADCRRISDSLKSCLTMDFRQVSEQHIEKRYLVQ
ncbi:hypothetical protein RF11_05106 [Thelohanellus kitauei]|uniref:Uncharacterized protein n=1 Tax=Thelohanellus kitauei TaxID=669202 RepID=A0A0C2MHQ1_THEKT|nr:hypothetical protein RF11_05106 [Thelohanellus kitauei]